jgi:hypothetical protein
LSDIILLFNLAAFEAGLVAIYFWLSVYKKAQRGSIAWLLFALTSVFMIGSALFPSILLFFSDLEPVDRFSQTMFFMVFWSAVYTSFFAGAGYELNRSLVKVPRRELGRFLVEGLVHAAPVETKGETPVPEPSKASRLLTGSTLIEYTPGNPQEDAIIELVLRFWGDLRNCIIVTSQPRAKAYMEKLEDIVMMGAIKIMDISRTAGTIESGEGMVKVPSGDVGRLKDVLGELPAGCVVLFDNVTRLVELEGPEKTRDYLSGLMGSDVVAFINKDAHPAEDVEKIAGLFDRTGEMAKDKIKVSGEEINLVTGEQFYLFTEILT